MERKERRDIEEIEMRGGGKEVRKERERENEENTAGEREIGRRKSKNEQKEEEGGGRRKKGIKEGQEI